MKKRMLVIAGAVSILSAVLLSACTIEKTQTTTATTAPTQASVATTAPQATPAATKVVSEEEVKHFNEYVKNIRGNSFLKSATIEGNKALVEYATYKEYSEIRGGKPPVDEKAYNDYWLTGDALRKALMEESVRILREIPSLGEIKIVTAPFNGKKQTATLDRKAAETFYKINLKELHDDKELNLWREKVAPQFTKENRDKFEKQFIKTE